MTINEIADLAGVSRATVSRYLNHGYVSEEKKEKIRKVMEETGYHPSGPAQMLRNRKTGMIGVIIPKLASDSISAMINGISSVLAANGYKLLLADTMNDEKEELRYLSFFDESQVDGVILFGTFLTQKHYELLNKLTIPVVVIGQKAEHIPCVYQNDYDSMCELALMALKNAKKIAFLGVPEEDMAAGKARKTALWDTAVKCGFDPEQILWKQGKFQMENGRTLMKEILEADPEIDTVISATDTMAIGAMLYCMEQDIKIPEQIQICGTGNSTMGQVVRPALSTVVFEYQQAGNLAAGLLLSLIRKEKMEKEEICMPYHLEVRKSLREGD